ncbi:MAG: hypothetical protein Q4B28_04140 [bacterium]|nr:hypothetical protein [bacterium]
MTLHSQDTAQQQLKTFAYQSIKSFHKSYKGWLTTYRNKQSLRDAIKIGILSSSALIFLLIYLYFINLASTKGYFMKVAQEELNASNAQSDIVKLEIVKEKRKNWNELTPTQHTLKKNLLTIEIPPHERE